MTSQTSRATRHLCGYDAPQFRVAAKAIRGIRSPTQR